MVRAMFGKAFPRRILTAILALGIVLSGAAPSWAMPFAQAQKKDATLASMTMPGTAMRSDCMAMMAKSTSQKNMPCKNPDGSCAAVCMSCALPIALLAESLVPMLGHDSDGNFTSDVNRNGVSSPPALPPPILRA